MDETTYKQLTKYGIKFLASPDSVQLGFGGKQVPMEFETPVQLRRGQYDIERLGAFSYLGGGSAVFRHIKSIGRFCSIAGNIVTGAMEHPTDFLSTHPLFYGNWESTWGELSGFYSESIDGYRNAVSNYSNRVLKLKTKIVIGNDVWIGEGAFISRGVTVGDGAIIAGRSVVTKDVPPYAIVGGTPAKIIRYRFDEETIARLLRIRWWDYGLSAVAGADFSAINRALDFIENKLSSGLAIKYSPRIVIVSSDGSIKALDSNC